MWQELLDEHDLEHADGVDLENSFFVGDAGGREAGIGGATKDHSCVDRFVHVRFMRMHPSILKFAGILQPT